MMSPARAKPMSQSRTGLGLRRWPIGLVVALALAGCSDDGSGESETPQPTQTAVPPTAETPAPLQVRGFVGLSFSPYVALDLADGGSECMSGGPEYNAIEAGVQVQVLDNAGAIVGTGSLGESVAFVDADGTRLGCNWPFEVTAAAGGSFYTVKVLDWSSEAIDEATIAARSVNILPEQIP